MLSLCQCGCRQPAPVSPRTYGSKRIRKGEQFRYIRDHYKRTGPVSQATRLKMCAAQRDRGPWSLDVKKKISISRGGFAVESPFVPGLLIAYSRRDRRWRCFPGGRTHARAVYAYFHGSIPEGLHVHHRDGKTENPSDDSPDNLALLPKQWNSYYFPILRKEFHVSEGTITDIYFRLVDKTSATELFKEICRVLLDEKIIYETT